ncbi:MAG: hypothetical protein RIB60_11240 [Phycisphaerales bacterium]
MARVHWCELERPITADDLLAAPPSAKHTNSVDEACRWLRARLEDGPVAAAELKELAEKEGRGWRIIQKVKSELGVISDRKTCAPRVMWVLPDQEAQRTAHESSGPMRGASDDSASPDEQSCAEPQHDAQ